jgi:hypothetical protein
MAEAEEYAGGDEDVAAAEQEEDVDEVRWSHGAWRLWLAVAGCVVAAAEKRVALQELETMKQRLKEMEDETNKLTAPAEGSDEGKQMTSNAAAHWCSPASGVPAANS